MSLRSQDDNQAVLQQLWGGFVPSLTAEQTDIAVKLWHKIKVRKQQEPKSDAERAN